MVRPPESRPTQCPECVRDVAEAQIDRLVEARRTRYAHSSRDPRFYHYVRDSRSCLVMINVHDKAPVHYSPYNIF